jgi:hypothetical protein
LTSPQALRYKEPMTPEQIREILRLHKLWLDQDPQGIKANLQRANLQRADLQNANLQGANLQRANLQGADLYGANLQRANLQGANLQGANLQGAYLQGAYLQGANLQGANLQGAYLRNANLQYADLRYTDLYGANLQGANLQRANLQRADLQGADLQGANLQRANLYGANLPDFERVPEEGAFIGWKKVRGPEGNDIVLKLEITEDSKRVSTPISHKCRAQKVKVLKAETLEGAQIPRFWVKPQEFESTFNVSFKYQVGQTLEVKDYDPDIRVECTKGIHFYMTKRAALEN